MITKENVDGTEHVIARLGTGDLTVAASYPYEHGKGHLDRLLICENGTGVIGEKNEALVEGMCSSELGNPIVFIFSKKESIDVVIKQLTLIKEDMP